MELQTVLDALSKHLGAIIHVSNAFAFDCTHYYEKEMGPELTRYFVAFNDLRAPQELTQIKEQTIQLEQSLFSANNQRCVNLDPGYIDEVKIVLASTKYGGHKIALSENIYADMVMDYFKGQFRTFEWSFPDFKGGTYDEYFRALRAYYLEKR